MNFRRSALAALVALGCAIVAPAANAAGQETASMAAKRTAITAAVTSMSNASGHITSVYVSQIYNLPFRITLDATLPGCPGNLLYADDEYQNYQVYVSALLFAYSQNKTVNIIYSAGTGGYCKIVEYGMSN